MDGRTGNFEVLLTDPAGERFALGQHSGHGALAVVRQRLEGIAAAAQVPFGSLPVQIITAPSLRLDTEPDRQRLSRTVQEQRPVLLILDPLIRLHRVDENDASQIALLEIDAILSNAIAQLSLPKPGAEKAKRGLEVGRKKLLELTQDESGRDPLLEAKRKLVLIYLGMAEKQFTDTDAEIFSILSEERALQDELERARKNN